MKSRPSIAALEPVGVRGRDHRVAGDGDERAHLALAGRVDLLGQAGDRQLAVGLGQPAHAAVPAPEAHALAAAAGAGRVALRRRGAREHRAALAVEVAGQHVEHVDQPAGERAELLRAGADAGVHGGARRGGQLARHAPDLLGVDPAGARHPLGREARARSAGTSSSPLRCSASAPGVDEVLLDERARHRGEQQRVGAGADEVVLVGLLGGAGAARVDHHDLAAALADARAAGRACRAPSAGCRSRRAGSRRGSAGGRCGRRPAPAPTASCRTSARPTPAWASGRRSRPCRCSASRAPAARPARRAARTGCARSGCRCRRRRRCGRARRAAATGGGRSPRTPRPRSPRPARRRGGPAAWSGGRGPRAAA